MIAASLFSGIGAPETAMPAWDWRWCAEIEKFPCAVLAERHSHSRNLGDVSDDGFAEKAGAVAAPDVLVFGSPCQSFSVAGKRLGLDDPRGNLALVALRLVGQLKPPWFVFENVPGLLSLDDGSAFGLFLRTVDELGYFGAWASLDAQYFGVAQRRQRVFFVGHSGNWRYPAAVLFEPESVCGHSPPRRQAGQGVAPTISSRPTGGGGLGTDFDCDGGLIMPSMTTRTGRGTGANGMDDYCIASHSVAQSLLAKANSSHRADAESYVAHALRADGFDASEDGTGRGTPLVPIAFSSKDHGADAGELAPTLRAGTHHKSHANAGVPPAVAFMENVRHELRVSECTDSLTKGGGKPGQGYAAAMIGSAVRRLTPRECERLQGFPDDYTAVTYRGKPAADGPRYKALGNSMAVPVVRWILTRIEHLTKHKPNAAPG